MPWYKPENLFKYTETPPLMGAPKIQNQTEIIHRPTWFGLKSHTEIVQHVSDKPSVVFGLVDKWFVITQPYNDHYRPGTIGIICALVYDAGGWFYLVEMKQPIKSFHFDESFEPHPHVSVADFFRCTLPSEACND